MHPKLVFFSRYTICISWSKQLLALLFTPNTTTWFLQVIYLNAFTFTKYFRKKKIIIIGNLHFSFSFSKYVTSWMCGGQLPGPGIRQTEQKRSATGACVVLPRTEELLQEVQTGGSLCRSDHALVEFMVSRNMDLEKGRSLNFRRAKFQLIKELLDEIPCEAVLGGKGTKQSCQLSKNKFLRAQDLFIPKYKKSSKGGRKLECGCARTRWSNWGKRNECKSSGSKDMWPGKNTAMLSGCAEMGSEKPRHGWNCTWRGMWKLTRGVRRAEETGQGEGISSELREGRTGYSTGGKGWGTQSVLGLFTGSQASHVSRICAPSHSWTSGQQLGEGQKSLLL